MHTIRFLEITQGHSDQLEGTMLALQRICEDATERLSMDNKSQPLHVLVPKLILYFSHSSETVRVRALESLHALLHKAVGLDNSIVDNLAVVGSSLHSSSSSPPLMRNQGNKIEICSVCDI